MSELFEDLFAAHSIQARGDLFYMTVPSIFCERFSTGVRTEYSAPAWVSHEEEDSVLEVLLVTGPAENGQATLPFLRRADGQVLDGNAVPQHITDLI